MRKSALPPLPFEFRDVRDDEASTGFVIRVPAHILSKADLLAALATTGRFPDYFGRNWDSLLDCLRDFHWIEEQRIVIAHTDLPLQTLPKECRTYLEILRDSVLDWTRHGDPDGNHSSMPLEHELLVLFPASLQSRTMDALRKQADGN